MELNWLAVGLAAVSAFVLGGLWYGPLFGKAWMAHTGMTEEKAAAMNKAKVFGLAFVLSLFAATVFAIFLGPEVSLQHGAMYGFAAGLFWVGAFMGINDLFEDRPFGLWAINAGYATVAFTLFGAIIGAMN